MKELYIRKGNLASNQNILIIGEESNLGGRDSAYKSKGTLHERYLVTKDPFSGAENLTYIHACKNILLISENFSRDYDVHRFLKSYCKDLLRWDGEANEGYTDSREAFIVKNGDIEKTVKILRERILSLVNPDGLFEKARSHHIFIKTRENKIKKPKSRIKMRLKLIILLLAAAIILGKIGVKKVQTAIEGIKLSRDRTYDYRNKMSGTNDEWLFDKCLHIICEEGGKAEWLNEAYYSKRFAPGMNYQVHFYNDYTVIRIKAGLSKKKEQKSIYMACRDVVKMNLND